MRKRFTGVTRLRTTDGEGDICRVRYWSPAAGPASTYLGEETIDETAMRNAVGRATATWAMRFTAGAHPSEADALRIDNLVATPSSSSSLSTSGKDRRLRHHVQRSSIATGRSLQCDRHAQESPIGLSESVTAEMIGAAGSEQRSELAAPACCRHGGSPTLGLRIPPSASMLPEAVE